MLTRIEIDGFKSFERFELDVPPFAVIVGPNAAGKSNLFDALRLLSQLAVTDVRSAMRELRGEPHEFFRSVPGSGPVDSFQIAVETLLPPRVRDSYGQEQLVLSGTRVRYEVTLERREVEGIERFYVAEERARPISKKQDRWAPHHRSPSKAFRQLFLSYSGRKSPFLDTNVTDQPIFEMHQDGTQGRVRRLPASHAEATALSTVTVAREFLHLYALREELRSLRYLQLDPAAERRPSPFDAPDLLERDGSNLAAVLFRIQQETRTSDRPRGALADIRADLAELIPGVTDLVVERDDERREYRLKLAMRDGQTFSSRVASDGTLRVLALVALLHDPRHYGTLLFEEPENGVSKRRLGDLMSYLRNRCTSTVEDSYEPDAALHQIIVNTHSPVAAAAVRDELIIADIVKIIEAGTARPRLATRMRPHRISDLGQIDPRGRASEAEIDRLLDVAEATELAG